MKAEVRTMGNNMKNLHCDVINFRSEFLEELRNIKLQVDMLCQVALKAQINTKVLISNFKVLLDIV